MNRIVKSVLASTALALAVAGPATADPYKDYTPVKGVWDVTTIKVDPNHIDDYLVGLKKAWIPDAEMMKKHGLIDNYFIMTNVAQAARGGNVIIGMHWVSFAGMDPDRARDEAMMAESRARMSKDQSEAMTNGFDKYRTFLDEQMWTAVDFDMK